MFGCNSIICLKYPVRNDGCLDLTQTLYSASFYCGMHLSRTAPHCGGTHPKAQPCTPTTYLTARLWSPLFGEFQRLHCLGGGGDGVVGQSLGCPASFTTWFATPLSRLVFQDSLCAAVHAALVWDHVRGREGTLRNHHYHRRGRREDNRKLP